MQAVQGARRQLESDAELSAARSFHRAASGVQDLMEDFDRLFRKGMLGVRQASCPLRTPVRRRSAASPAPSEHGHSQRLKDLSRSAPRDALMPSPEATAAKQLMSDSMSTMQALHDELEETRARLAASEQRSASSARTFLDMTVAAEATRLEAQALEQRAKALQSLGSPPVRPASRLSAPHTTAGVESEDALARDAAATFEESKGPMESTPSPTNAQARVQRGGSVSASPSFHRLPAPKVLPPTPLAGPSPRRGHGAHMAASPTRLRSLHSGMRVPPASVLDASQASLRSHGGRLRGMSGDGAQAVQAVDSVTVHGTSSIPSPAVGVEAVSPRPGALRGRAARASPSRSTARLGTRSPPFQDQGPDVVPTVAGGPPGALLVTVSRFRGPETGVQGTPPPYSPRYQQHWGHVLSDADSGRESAKDAMAGRRV